MSDNSQIFDFFRRRHENVVLHAEKEQIEAVILWGASVDALAALRAHKHGRKTKSNRKCFIRELSEVLPALKTVSIPVLAHAIRTSPHKHLGRLLDKPVFHPYHDASSVSRTWRVDDDRRLQPALESIKSDIEEDIWENSSYAGILYKDFRCTAVHALSLGWRVTGGANDDPHFKDMFYQHYSYSAEDPLKADMRIRTRLGVTTNYLASLLGSLILAFERECSNDRYTIPPHATLL